MKFIFFDEKIFKICHDTFKEMLRLIYFLNCITVKLIFTEKIAKSSEVFMARPMLTRTFEYHISAQRERPNMDK